MRGIVALVLVLCALATQAETLVAYLPPNGTNPVAPSIVGGHLQGQNLSRGAGIKWGSGSTFNSTEWNATDLPTAVASNEYVEWGFTVDAGHEVSVTNLAVRYDRSASGPTGLMLRSSVDGFINDLYSDNAISEAGEEHPLIPLALTGVTGTVTFRFYAWGASGVSGTFDIEPTVTFDPVASNGLIVAGLVASTARTLYVDISSTNPIAPYASPATAAADIHTALTLATDGETVLVLPGVYVLSRELHITNGITLRGAAGAEMTVLDGARATRCVNLAHPGAVVEGLTLRNGVADVGGGVLCDGGGTVRDCAITLNSATNGYTATDGWGGGGVYCLGGGFVSNCLVAANTSSNEGGGVMCYGGGWIVASVIDDNTSGDDGGGACMRAGGVISNCTVRGNYSGDKGGGIHCRAGGLATHCKVVSNSCAWAGGGVWLRDTGLVQRCLIVGNRAALGGGLALYIQSQARHCTIAGNIASNFGGGLCWWAMGTNGAGTVANAVVWANAAPTGANWYADGTLGVDSITYTCSTPLIPGTANIDSDPRLSTGYRLSGASPCIDAGLDLNTGADLDGDPAWDCTLHPNNPSIVDIGADEFIDTDSDTLADAWETDCFGGISAGDACADADPDADGLMNGDEAANGTDPCCDDSDVDCIPDGWEFSHGLAPTLANGDADADGDGAPNADEFVADTNPTNPASLFQIDSAALPPAATLTCLTSTGRVYYLELAMALRTIDWMALDGTNRVQGTGGPLNFELPTTNPAAFYRIKVALP